MRARAFVVAATIALAAHAVLLLAWPWHGPASAAAAPRARAVATLVLLDPRRPDRPPASLHKTIDARADALRSVALAGASERSRPSSSPPAGPPAGRAMAIGIYRATATLDVPARARSAPDITLLSGLTWSGLPLRMRLFIDDEGAVVDAQVLRSAESDDVVERVRRMFLATGFTAGVQGGRPVPSYKDIEMTIGTPS
jgi:hypothetical protein